MSAWEEAMFFFHTVLFQEYCLWKWKRRKKESINATERYFIYFGSPEVYKVLTAAKYIWYVEKRQQMEELEEAK